MFILSIFSVSTLNYTLFEYEKKNKVWSDVAEFWIEPYLGAYDIIKDKTKKEVMITSLPHMAYLAGFPYKNIYFYRYLEKDRFNKLEENIRNYKNGIIVLDKKRNGGWSQGLPYQDFDMGGKKVKLIKEIDGIYIYEF
ncbi:hypothetical protein KGV52_00770 [Candidatus Gracilibacteria bacterium]|nr:hypothetical protein [Candidatus Gracilibacteria bacterium]